MQLGSLRRASCIQSGATEHVLWCPCAALNCLMRYHGVEDHIALVDRPSLVLSAEAELGITAGLQDRVIQVIYAADHGLHIHAVAQCSGLWVLQKTDESCAHVVCSLSKIATAMCCGMQLSRTSN